MRDSSIHLISQWCVILLVLLQNDTLYHEVQSFKFPCACGPLGLLAIAPNPISAAGSNMSKPCLCCVCLLKYIWLFGSCVGTLLLPRRTAVHPHLLLATEAKNNCTYAFPPEKQFGNWNIVRNFKRYLKAYTKDMTDIHPFKMFNKIKSWLTSTLCVSFPLWHFIATVDLLQS